MEAIGWLWTVMMGIFGLCGTGFFFLNNRLNKLSDHIDMSKSFATSFETLVKDVHEIKTALLGDFEKPGLIKKVHDLDKDINEIKVKVNV